MENTVSVRAKITDRQSFGVLIKAIYRIPSDVEIDTIIPLKIPILAECGIITHQLSIQLQTDYQSRRTSTTRIQLFVFLQRLYQHVPLPRFLESISLLGLSNLKDSITTILLSQERQRGHADYQYSQFLRKIFYQYKSYCDDNVFICRKTHLRGLFDKFLQQIRDTREGRKRDKLAIRCHVALWLLMQQMLAPSEIEDLLHKFENELQQLNVDRTLPDILIHIKYAIVAAFRSDHLTSMDLLSHATYLTRPYCDPGIIYMINHSGLFLHRLELSRNDNDENQQQASEVCQHNLNMILEDKMDEFGMYGYRSFCLYEVHIHLHIGPYLEMDSTRVVSQSDIIYIERMLRRVKESFKSGQLVEARRKMMFYVSKARLYKLKGDIPRAIENVLRAQHIMGEGFQYRKEMENVRNFRESLQFDQGDDNESETLPQPNLLQQQ